MVTRGSLVETCVASLTVAELPAIAGKTDEEVMAALQSSTVA